MSISIQSLSDSDLEAAAMVLASAFQRSGDWVNELRFCRRLQPDGYFGAFQDGMLVGMVGATIYSNFAHVGMMGIHEQYQRQGIGYALMQHLLRWLDEKNIFEIQLDASEMGQPMYEKLGFVAFNEVYVLQGQPGRMPFRRSPEAQRLSHHNLDLITVTDTRCFGANRSKLLQALLEVHPQQAFLVTDGQGGIQGYIIAREKRLGPWVMQDPAKAELLLQTALSFPFHAPVSVVVPHENMEAITLLHRHGFETMRINTRMVRGLVAPTGLRRKIFAQTSLSLG